ncbi:tetratricopeptide repeat protein [Azospirillum sp.]|uniref:tetratricopeptide repeat protein n=1 Tax=Azospirillum sp. TaxID=34012 RepID=UPI003D760A35
MTLNEAYQLAFQHHRAGRHTDAVGVCKAILRSVPEQKETLLLLGVTEFLLGNPDVAGAALVRALSIDPGFNEALVNLASVRQRQGRLGDAVAMLSRAIGLKPSPEAYLNRGSALHSGGNRDAAAEDFTQAIELRPDDTMALNNLGMIMRDRGYVGRAVALHRRAIAVSPEFAVAWRDLAHALREAGRLAGAVGAYARSIALDPTSTETKSYHLFAKQAVCDWNGYEALVRETGDIIDHDRGIVLPLAILSIETTAAQQLRAARHFFRTLVKAPPHLARPVPTAPSAADGRLRIAYFSADFHEHATAYLAAEMFELHDRTRFSTFAYSFGQDDGSPMRRRLIAAFDTFRDIRSVGIDQVRRLMAEDGIDILVDLKGYTKQSRLDLLSCRLAPVQVAYLGFPGTIGSDCMDYIVGDRFVTPLEHQHHFSERIVVMPDAYQINDRHRPLNGRVPSRAECGLPEDGFVFSAFNTTYKMSPRMFGAWMRLLGRLPNSVLWLFEANADAVGNLRRAAAAHGIDPARVVFAPKRPLADHLARYRVADLALDSYPYTGHTTTSDALWMGLPTVTLIGDTFASRVAASLLSAARMDELITTSLADYEALALSLAHQPERLAALRRQLEETRLSVPLFDSRRFTRHLERAYTTMWDIHRSGRPPQPFAVEPLPPGTPA